MEYIADMPDMVERIYDNMPRKHTMACGIPWFLTQDIGDMFGKYITDDIFLGLEWRKVEGSGEWSTFYKGRRNPGSSNPQFQTLIPYKTLFVKHIKPFFMPKKPYKNV